MGRAGGDEPLEAPNMGALFGGMAPADPEEASGKGPAAFRSGCGSGAPAAERSRLSRCAASEPSIHSACTTSFCGFGPAAGSRVSRASPAPPPSAPEAPGGRGALGAAGASSVSSSAPAVPAASVLRQAHYQPYATMPAPWGQLPRYNGYATSRASSDGNDKLLKPPLLERSVEFKRGLCKLDPRGASPCMLQVCRASPPRALWLLEGWGAVEWGCGCA
ncbi:unnamed protein product [Prorocentrum cordatum]|uniref:Uncharacterized protein n=1 Tax=Prorocentrum cordatum TaxID=2364126 RepID=A0ABN9X4F0_9DINO|nr:unnamed protein product [Polarella glacialis]